MLYHQKNTRQKNFRGCFREITGLNLPINNKASGSAGHVYIGESDSSNMPDEELCVIVKEDSLAISGGRPRGTLYGVYQFFEDGAGVRFLIYDHTYIPKADSLKIPFGKFCYNPPFSFRWSYYAENSKEPEFAARLRVNTVTTAEKLGGKTPQNLIGHSVDMLLPFSQYGAEHPEYYALVDGVRDTNTDGGGPQLCVSNPEVIKLVAENAIKHLDKHPGLRISPSARRIPPDTAIATHARL